jgi:hypothetical protein
MATLQGRKEQQGRQQQLMGAITNEKSQKIVKIANKIACYSSIDFVGSIGYITIGKV